MYYHNNLYIKKTSMAHIDLGNDLPGIRGPMAYRPETAMPLNALAEVLLRDDNNTLSRGERELIGAYVSSLNDCFFCQNVHGSLAQHYLGCDMPYIDAVKRDPLSTPISDKLKALLAIAASVQKGGRSVRPEQIEAARRKARPTGRSMTRCSSRQPSVCITAMSTGWRPGHRRTGSSMLTERPEGPRKDISIMTFANN